MFNNPAKRQRLSTPAAAAGLGQIHNFLTAGNRVVHTTSAKELQATQSHPKDADTEIKNEELSDDEYSHQRSAPLHTHSGRLNLTPKKNSSFVAQPAGFHRGSGPQLHPEQRDLVNESESIPAEPRSQHTVPRNRAANQSASERQLVLDPHPPKFTKVTRANGYTYTGDPTSEQSRVEHSQKAQQAQQAEAQKANESIKNAIANATPLVIKGQNQSYSSSSTDPIIESHQSAAMPQPFLKQKDILSAQTKASDKITKSEPHNEKGRRTTFEEPDDDQNQVKESDPPKPKRRKTETPKSKPELPSPKEEEEEEPSTPLAAAAAATATSPTGKSFNESLLRQILREHKHENDLLRRLLKRKGVDGIAIDEVKARVASGETKRVAVRTVLRSLNEDQDQDGDVKDDE